MLPGGRRRRPLFPFFFLATVMSDFPWHKKYHGDWLGGVAGLSAAERGIYETLLCLMYDAAGPILRDDGRLARKCGCPPMPFRRALEVLVREGKITQDGDMLSNPRVEKEIAIAQKKSVAMKKNGALGLEKKKENQYSNLANASNRLDRSQKLEDNTNVLSKRAPAKADAAAIREALKTCLSDADADDLIAHRKRKRAPLTLRAAKELVTQFVACGDPKAAVGAMIRNDWRGFEADWLARAGPRQANPSISRGGPARALNQIERMLANAQEARPVETLELLPFSGHPS